MGRLETKGASMLKKVGAALVGALIWAGSAQAASFDCDQPGLALDEQAICDNRDLNDADVKMATTFRFLSGLFAMGTRHNMQDEQRDWLKSRRRCGADLGCLRQAYETRLNQLDQTYNDIDRPI